MAGEHAYFDDLSGDDEGGLDIGRLLRGIRRHRVAVLAVAAGLMVPAIVYPFLIPDQYEATATIEVLDRPEVLDVGAEVVSEAYSRRDPLEPLKALTQSDAVLGPVIDAMDRGGPPKDPGVLGRAKILLGLSVDPRALSPEQLRARRIGGIRANLELRSGIGQMWITYTANDPQQAAQVANAIANSLVTYRSEQRSAGMRNATSWLNTQIFTLAEQINRKEEGLAALVAEEGILPNASSVDLGQEWARLSSELKEAQFALVDVRQRLAELEARLQAEGEKGDDLSELELIAAQYEDARARLEQARLTYTPTHPEVRRLEAVVESLAQKLGPNLGNVASALSPAEMGELRRLRSEEGRLKGRTSALRASLEMISDPQGTRSAALIDYRRRERELEIDRDMLSQLQRRLSETQLRSAQQYENETIRDPAIVPISPAYPDRALFILAGVVLAIGTGLGTGVLLELFDPTVADPNDLKRLMNVPVLGMIPLINDGTPPERQSEGPPSSLSAESYRNLRTALLFSVGARKLSTLVVSSAQAGEGKTTVTSNLASSFAQAGRRVLLIDGDMRLPRSHKVFGMPPSPGLAELIRGEVTLQEAIRRPAEGQFDVLTAGRTPPNPSELLASPDFAILFNRIQSSYDLVLIDSPVLLGVSDGYVIGAQADAMLLVHRPGSVEKRGLEQVQESILRAGINLIGVVFNQLDRSDRHFYPAYMESPYISKGRDVRRRSSERLRARL